MSSTPAENYKQRLIARQAAETPASKPAVVSDKLHETHVVVGDHTPERRRA